MTDFKHLLFLVNGFLVQSTLNLFEKVEELAQKLDCKIQVIPVSLSIDSALKSFPPEADAVYVSSLLHLKNEEFENLVSDFKRRKLPSFSFIGEREVEKGILASLNPDPCTRIVRRIGINIQRILMGDDPSILPVYYSTGEKLTLNTETARAIEFEPATDVLFDYLLKLMLYRGLLDNSISSEVKMKLWILKIVLFNMLREKYYKLVSGGNPSC